MREVSPEELKLRLQKAILKAVPKTGISSRIYNRLVNTIAGTLIKEVHVTAADLMPPGARAEEVRLTEEVVLTLLRNEVNVLEVEKFIVPPGRGFRRKTAVKGKK